MTSLHTVIAAAAGTLLLSGTAFAAMAQPAAGEGPFEGASATDLMASSLQRRTVAADAVMHQPAEGRFNATSMPLPPSTLTRLQVHQSVLDAVAHGFRIGIN